MIRATRQSIRQDVDGCEVVLTISEKDLPELLKMSPAYGDAIELHQFYQSCSTTFGPDGAAKQAAVVASLTVGGAKPPTQSIAPAGTEFGRVMTLTAASKEAVAARSLCDNPWFQQFAKSLITSAEGEDDLAIAINLMVQRVLNGAIWDSEAGPRFQALMVEYRDWCAKKGYRE